MDILEATDGYESWLARACEVNAAELRYKHRLMADTRTAFPFFRATYYWWAATWTDLWPELADAPRVLAVGDLHVENFGTWRDAEGRLVWGVNDFDEAAELPYTNDLVRLAVSLRFARNTGVFRFRFDKACAALLAGYANALHSGGRPFVLEEENRAIRTVAMTGERDPARFWAKLTKLLADPPADPPPAAFASATHMIPVPPGDWQFRFRSRVGGGNLGKPRYAALARWAGGWVAREAKKLTPPASNWFATQPIPSASREAVERGVRCPDPYYNVGPEWIVRRLAPRCSRIELSQLTRVKDAYRLFRAMGAEAANIHLGTADAAEVYNDQLDRPGDWLELAARDLAKSVKAEWVRWRDATG